MFGIGDMSRLSRETLGSMVNDCPTEIVETTSNQGLMWVGPESTCLYDPMVRRRVRLVVELSSACRVFVFHGDPVLDLDLKPRLG
jgi:hypothetical protein